MKCAWNEGRDGCVVAAMEAEVDAEDAILFPEPRLATWSGATTYSFTYDEHGQRVESR